MAKTMILIGSIFLIFFGMYLIPSDFTMAQDAEQVWVRSYDGIYLQAFVRKPSGSEPLPAVMFIHGGVGGGAQPQRKTAVYGRVQSHFFAEGYVVFQPEYRRFHFGQEELEDILAAYFYLKSFPYVDKDRIAVIGGSHGGYLTEMLITKVTPAAAVSFAGLTDIAEMFADDAKKEYENTCKDKDWKEKWYYNGKMIAEIDRGIEMGTYDINMVRRRQTSAAAEVRLELGMRFGDDRAKYENISPISIYKKIKCPLLYLVGSEDRLKIAGKRLVDKLSAMGRTVEYSEHPGMGHGFYWGGRRDPDGNIPEEYYRALKRTTDFVNKYVKNSK